MGDYILKLVTFNIRVDTPIDDANRFSFRKSALITYLKEQSADIYGFQEVLPDMNMAVARGLTEYSWVGAPRSENGEACPIYYRSDRIQVIDSGTFWLSPTSDRQSVIAGSHFIRIASFIVFRYHDFPTLAYFNTHLDYASDEISKKQFGFLLEKANEIADKHEALLIVGGDFNAKPDSKTVLEASCHGLISIYKQALKPSVTYHNFGNIMTGEPIDHIFFDQRIKLLDCQIDTRCYNSTWLSDHYPVIAQLAVN
jgi:endonuclease/exonuclease/phosphatase family metal-dependent hydrolase